ncbi:hypothetical protein [Zobellella maritima]|uniref:hypothetical protein n=1 Tax=Zobellella maritima TaxID=2059725 RepID=UPI0018E5615B|nr:hypothetical protein [Zobellella maritima]
MKDSIFLTVMAGVSVFVMGQFILKLVLEPIVSFKEALGGISGFFLRHNAKITNGNADSDLQHDLRILISTVISKKEAIPFYRFFGFILGLPSENKLLKGCRNLNFIWYEMNKNTASITGQPNCIEISMHLNETADLLKIRLDYREL